MTDHQPNQSRGAVAHPALENLLVVKIGGGAGLDLPACIADLAYAAAEHPLVVVHGVSAEANRLCTERGVPVRMMTSPSGHSSRHTDAQTREIFVEAARNVNAQVIAEFNRHSVQAQLAENTIRGERKKAVRAVVDGRVRIIRDNYTGSITEVHVDPLLERLTQGVVPVIPPEAFNADDGLLNIDGDRGAAAVAAALNADHLIILSNVRGLYQNFPDENTFVGEVSRRQLDDAMGWAQGRMKRKVLGAQEALNGGVTRVTIADGRVANPIQNALAGNGTDFTQ